MDQRRQMREQWTRPACRAGDELGNETAKYWNRWGHHAAGGKRDGRLRAGRWQRSGRYWRRTAWLRVVTSDEKMDVDR